MPTNTYTGTSRARHTAGEQYAWGTPLLQQSGVADVLLSWPGAVYALLILPCSLAMLQGTQVAA